MPEARSGLDFVDVTHTRVEGRRGGPLGVAVGAVLSLNCSPVVFRFRQPGVSGCRRITLVRSTPVPSISSRPAVRR